MQSIPDDELQEGSPPYCACNGIYEAICYLTCHGDEEDEPPEPAPPRRAQG